MLFPKGFSANLVLITWSIFGSVLAYGFLANLRMMLLKPVLEPTVDTMQDILDSGLIPFTYQGNYILKIYMTNSPNNATSTIGKRLYVAANWEEYESMTYTDVLEGTHILFDTAFSDTDRFHTSRDTLGGAYPYISDIANRKWPLIGDYNKHINGYIQVCLHGSKHKDKHY